MKEFDLARKRLLNSGMSSLAMAGRARVGSSSLPGTALATCTDCQPGCATCPKECSGQCSTALLGMRLGGDEPLDQLPLSMGM